MILHHPLSGRVCATVDFEFFYDTEYSLSRMPTAQFMRDPRFELICGSVQIDDSEPPHFFVDNDLDRVWEWFKPFELEDKCVVAHHAIIEGSILEWKLGIQPAQYFCTSTGPRPFAAAFSKSMSLKDLSDYWGTGHKGDEAIKAKGKHFADMATSGELLTYAAYCANDVILTRKNAAKALAMFAAWDDSKSELDLIDLTIKKFTRPRLHLDPKVISERQAALAVEKRQALIDAGLPAATDEDYSRSTKLLNSNVQFASLLVTHGVTPPTKISPTTGLQTYAFSKTDMEFIELRGDPRVAKLVTARLKHKSSIEESRLERFAALAEQSLELPVPLVYYGAHPGRFSGLDKINLQNLGRGSKLRAALVAPPGHQIVAGDLAQIEARITATLAQAWGLVAQFAKNVDVYADFASLLYNKVVTKDTFPTERFVGKTAILSLGYQAGVAKFFHTLNAVFGTPFTMEEAGHVVRTYRQTYWQIPQLWARLEQVIVRMMDPNIKFDQVGPVLFCHEHLRLPNGMPIHYHDLHRGADGQAYYQFAKEKKTLYGGKLLENIVQALARIILTTAEIRLARAGLRAALSVHDELVFVIPNRHVEVVKQVLTKALSAPVPWLPRVPVACEVKHGDSYYAAK